ncbi:MAG: DNA mismatch repair protein MutS [Candidatus Omnitrophica bacterium]|nr:DNA mismatch repair protein MutS [Candidatus Omnitrophota bacterium]
MIYISTMKPETPMLTQYAKIKAQHKDAILFFRLGDFYEMFYDDAKIASAILNVVLTARSNGSSGKVPMCGIPYHSAENYITRLIKAGKKVAICEQLEDPSKTKGIVKRDVIRTITSGTFIDDNSTSARYLFSVSFGKDHIGLAFRESSSSIIQTNQYDNIENAAEVISKFPIHECIYPEYSSAKAKQFFKHPLLVNKDFLRSPVEDWLYNLEMSKKSLSEHFKVASVSGFGIEGSTESITASAALLEYLKQMNKQPLLHIDKLSLYTGSKFLYLSPAACYGLELDLLSKYLDKTKTPFGKRKFKDWLYHPLKNVELIKQRQNAIVTLREYKDIHEKLGFLLSNTPDIEKSISRISCRTSTPKDIIAIKTTLVKVPEIEKLLSRFSSSNTLFSIKDVPELCQLLENSINDDIPSSNYQGKIIKRGFNKELDDLKSIQENCNDWLRDYQAKEIKRSGINTLKVGFNQVFGYYIVVSKANAAIVPQDYIRKQTLVNAERFITPELKEFEEKMLTADEKVFAIEKELVDMINAKILSFSSKLYDISNDLATIDVLFSMTKLSHNNGYILPTVNDSDELNIIEGRHPIVEATSDEPFVANSTHLDRETDHLHIITGPNMAGKSTYIRQTAILTIMSQMGSFIPAQSASVGLVDKIFTRIGAHDDITKGQSTFMVEMTEAADILNNITPKSLVILDEIGRGTSTYDGLSIAWAVAEFLQKKQVRTLFATHFHELTILQDQFKGVKNYNISVKEWEDNIVFLHKIVPGGCDDSYGIYVAKLAGIPNEVIKRSSEILSKLELSNDLSEKLSTKKIVKENQMTFFSDPSSKQDPELQKIKNYLLNIDPNDISPMHALELINKWKGKINGQN